MLGSNFNRNFLTYSNGNNQRFDAALGFKQVLTVNDFDQLTRYGIGVAFGWTNLKTAQQYIERAKISNRGINANY